MLSESHPFIRRIIRFLLLPYCFVRLVNWKECTKSHLEVLFDFIYIFFVLKDYPDNYGACRLWEVRRSDWGRYFGSNYNPYQKSKLRREVNPLDLQIVFNDKHVCDLLCRGIGAPVPDFYGIIEPGESLEPRLQQCFARSGLSRLIVKPIYGHAGLGVQMAYSEPDGIRLLMGKESRPARGATVSERCIVQGVVSQDPRISAISPSSINTIRVLTMFTKVREVMIIAASMRFGVGNSVVDNWSAGGVAVGVDHQSGRLLSVGYDKLGNRYACHPVSHFAFSGFAIPRWDEVERLAKMVQAACPFYKLLGMDIAVTEFGVVLIEINPDADIVFQEQTSGPLFSNRRTWQAFRDYDLFINRAQRALY